MIVNALCGELSEEGWWTGYAVAFVCTHFMFFLVVSDNFYVVG
jgi:hypothetical protein